MDMETRAIKDKHSRSASIHNTNDGKIPRASENRSSSFLEPPTPPSLPASSHPSTQSPAARVHVHATGKVQKALLARTFDKAAK